MFPEFGDATCARLHSQATEGPKIYGAPSGFKRALEHQDSGNVCKITFLKANTPRYFLGGMRVF